MLNKSIFTIKWHRINHSKQKKYDIDGNIIKSLDINQNNFLTQRLLALICSQSSLKVTSVDGNLKDKTDDDSIFGAVGLRELLEVKEVGDEAEKKL